MITLLLRTRIKSAVNTFIKSGKKKNTGKMISLIAVLFLMMFIFLSINRFFMAVSRFPGLSNILLDNILILSFFGFMVLLLFSGITISIYFLFTKTDLPLLMSTPIPLKTIFTYKFIENLFTNSYTYIFFCLPIVISYGYARDVNFTGYLYLILIAIVFFLFPTGLSLLGSLLLVKLIPAKRAQDYITAVYGFIFLVVFIGVQLIKTSAFNINSPDYNPQTIGMLSDLGESSFFKWIPSTWAVFSVSYFVKGQFSKAVSYLLPLLVVSGFSFVISVRLMQHLFLRGVGTGYGKIKKVKIRTKAKIRSIINTIMIKDFTVMKRDTRLLTQNLFGLIILSVFPFIIESSNESPVPFLGEYRPYFLILLFLSMVSAQIVSRALPMEGKSFWFYKISPNYMRTAIIAKMLYNALFLIPYLLVLLTVIFIVYKTSLVIFLNVAVASIFIVLTSCSIGILFGALMPKFDWENPKRMLKGSGNIIVMAADFIFIFLYGGSVFVLTNVLTVQISTIHVMPIIIIVGLLFSVLFLYGAIKLGGGRLEKYQWDM